MPSSAASPYEQVRRLVRLQVAFVVGAIAAGILGAVVGVPLLLGLIAAPLCFVVMATLTGRALSVSCPGCGHPAYGVPLDRSKLVWVWIANRTCPGCGRDLTIA